LKRNEKFISEVLFKAKTEFFVHFYLIIISLDCLGDDGDGGVAPSWTGGMGQGCAPVFQPFGEPTSNIPLNTPSPGSKVREECTVGENIIVTTKIRDD
jgi:hypothetical protein